LIEELARPLGGIGMLDEVTAQRVRTCAAVSLKLELLASAAARGEPVDGTELAALSSQQGRLLKALAPPKRPEPAHTLADWRSHVEDDA
jgi:hypothetical protein